MISPLAYANETTWIPFEATYIAKLNGDIVDDQAKRELKHLGKKRFHFSATAKSGLFKVEEFSEFEVIATGIQPQQYQSTRSIPFNTRKEALGFDWKKKELHYKDRKKSGTRKLKGEIYDPLSSFYVLANQVKNGATLIEFKEAKGRKLKDRKFTVGSPETIETPYGKLDTIKLHKKDKERETFIWLAPTLDYLAVKVRQVDNDGSYELVLVDYDAKAPVVFQFGKQEATEPTEPVLDVDIK